MSGDRGPCMATAPTLQLGGATYPAPPCSLLAGHTGAHHNDDGTSWTAASHNRNRHDGELMTDAEHGAIEILADLWDLLCKDVVAAGPSRDEDLAELATHIHALQHIVLAQAAARAFPGRYRLLGGQLPANVEEGP